MTEQVNPTPEAVEEAPKKKRVWLIVLIVIGVLLLCCVALGVIGLLFGAPVMGEVFEQVQATLTAMPAY